MQRKRKRCALWDNVEGDHSLCAALDEHLHETLADKACAPCNDTHGGHRLVPLRFVQLSCLALGWRQVWVLGCHCSKEEMQRENEEHIMG